MAKTASSLSSANRVTVTLAAGQRDVLDRIAEYNGTTRAHVVRHIVAKFIDDHTGEQLKLEFPPDSWLEQ